MKQYIFTLLTFVAVLPVLSAQTPIYIQFETGCVNQLEYQYTYTGQSLLMYSVAKGENELYFFVIGNKEPATTEKAPNGTVLCKSDEINATLIDNINAGGRLAYIVFKTQNGFISFPVETAGYIARSGTYFAFRTANYDFVMDTSSINYARNLSRPGVASPVYLTGRRSQDCLQLYAFRLEPAQPDAPRADVEVIPGIGVITNRTGHNGSEMEQNVYRLLKVNGISLEDYAYAVCHNPKSKENASDSFITSLPPDANPNDAFKVENPFAEPDKETYYTQPNKPNDNVQLAKCPTPPGYGYHIVQPGDSLHSIARIYNVTEKSLMEWNKIQNPKLINVCDKIWIIPQTTTNAALPATGYHVVQKGETLFSIARKYNITVTNIRQWNNLKSDDIQSGQRLLVSKNQATALSSGNLQGNPDTPNQPAISNAGPGNSQAGRLLHKTRSGETLNAVAWKYGYTTPYLRHINRYNKNLPPGNDDRLPEGVFLTVSDGKGDREDLTSFAPPPPENSGNAHKNNGGGIQGTTVAPPPATFEYIGEYIVKDDDNLTSIAQRYGITPEKLAAANNLKPGQEPAPRSILKIPK